MLIKDEVVDEISWCVVSSMGWSDLYEYTVFKSIDTEAGVSIETARKLITEIKRNKE